MTATVPETVRRGRRGWSCARPPACGASPAGPPSRRTPPAADAAPTAVAAPADAGRRGRGPSRPRRRRPRSGRQSLNNLKQIVLAMHNYHDANGHFPRDITDKDGKPLLSWRVPILPYIEQDAPVQAVQARRAVGQREQQEAAREDARTSIRSRVRARRTRRRRTTRGSPGRARRSSRARRSTSPTFTDGTSNTLGVVEAGPPVEWTKPADIAYDPKKPLPKLDGPFTNVLIAATADGAVHTFRRDLDETTLRRLIERADGEPVSSRNSASRC